VNVSTTLPAAVSALLWEYVGFNEVDEGENVPEPLVVHTPLPVVDVADITTPGLFAHIVCEEAAVTTGIGSTVTISVPTGLIQPLTVIVHV